MLPYRKYVVSILLPLAITSFAAVVYAMHEMADFSWEVMITDAFINTLNITLAGWVTLLLVNTFPTRVGVITYAVIVSTVFSVIACFATIGFLRWYEADQSGNYIEWLTVTQSVRYILTWAACGWVGTYAGLQKQTQALEKQITQQADAALLLREAELFKLRQQLQPHFLYNSLNSISALTMIEPAKAQEMIGKLSDFLRSSVKREAQEIIAVQEELTYIESYLSIESIRFGDRLRIEIEKGYVDHAQLPPFLMQPVLENAIKFGLYGRTGQVAIKLSIQLHEGMLYITVSNPYDAQSQVPRGTGFGLEGIRRRLYLLYGRTDLLETNKNNELFTTTLKIPQSNV